MSNHYNNLTDENDNLNKNSKETIENKNETPTVFIEWRSINLSVKLPNSSKKINNESENLNKNDNDLSKKLNNSINNDENVKNIVVNNSGYALPGEILAILGPSGCGKTSLLNLIAKRQVPKGKEFSVSGDVYCNGVLMDDNNFGKVCSYIMQDDILIEFLTPYECLTYGAKLRLNESDEVISNRVNLLIKQVRMFNFSLD